MTTFTTLSSGDKAAITLSGGNLIWTGTGANGGARSIDPMWPASQYYFECNFSHAVSSDTGVGISRAGAAYSTLNSAATGGAIAYVGFPPFVNGSPTGINIGTITTGVTVGVAVDTSAQLIWWTCDGTHWNSPSSLTNSPSGGVGGISWSSLTKSVYPTVTSAATSEAGTMNFGNTAFTYSVPAGFASGIQSFAALPAPGTIPRSQQIAATHEDDQLQDGWETRLRHRRYVTTWSAGLGESVSKFVQYDVLSSPNAMSVAKFAQYDVLSSPDALDVSKFVQYLVVEQEFVYFSAPQTQRFRNFFQHQQRIPRRGGGSKAVTPGANASSFFFVIT